VHLKELVLASEVIFNNSVKVEKTQTGCVRFWYLPDSTSKTTRPYRCQPELTIQRAVIDRELRKFAELMEGEKEAIRIQLVPRYTSTEYGNPGYSQLGSTCAEGDKHRGWATGALDSSGSWVYPAGVYMVRAELDLNKIKDTYTSPDDRYFTHKTVTALMKVTLTEESKESSVRIKVSSSSLPSGDTVRMSGSAKADKVFLSIRNAVPPEKRSKMTALTVLTVDGNPTTFTGVDVGRDGTWPNIYGILPR
jgi:hypothetical protein